MNKDVKEYGLVTSAYWGFTLTDGALRMLVVLYFHQLGYSPLAVASLFLFYEFFGIVTNLFGGWLAARFGLKSTLFSGLFLQIVALTLLAQTQWLGIAYVMALQAMSGIAKDLNKMSAKTAIKQLVPHDQSSRLFYWISVLTGSKNALKGLGFFLGGWLLHVLGYTGALYCLAGGLTLLTILVGLNLTHTLQAKQYKAKFSEVFSTSPAVNWLSGARCFLFAARDVWFVVALPVFLTLEAGWSSQFVGAMMAAWVIVYGMMQSSTPKLLGFSKQAPTGRHALYSAIALLLVLAGMIAIAQYYLDWQRVALIGLLLFAVVFAINSAIHSFLIVHYARSEGASMDVGFYYMANAGGRLLGTVLSGYLYQTAGFSATIYASFALVCVCVLISTNLPKSSEI